MSVKKPGCPLDKTTAEPAPYCIRPKPRTRPTAHTPIRTSSESGPKKPRKASRLFLEETRLAENRQMVQVVLKKKRVSRNFRVTRLGRIIASKASQITIRKITTPAAKAPGNGTIGGIVFV